MARFAALVFLGLGFLMVVASLVLPWFVLATGWAESGDLVTRDARATRWFRVGLIVMLGALFFGGLILRKKGVLNMVVVWAAVVLPVILWFPQWVIVHDSETSGEAAWLQQQHDNLTWLGGDVYRAHSERAIEGGMALNMQDPPLKLAAFRAPMVGVTSVGIAEVPDLIWWFGYNPAFSQFAGKGWFMAWMGVLFIGMGGFGFLRGSEGKRRRALLKQAALTGGAVTGIVAIAGFVPVWAAGSALTKARTQTLAGDWQPAIASLDRAEQWMPALAFDTGIIFQRGRLESLMGGSGPCAKIYQVWELERAGHGGRAELLLEDLELKRELLPRVWARELSRSWLRVAVDDFNSGKVGKAGARFDLLYEKEPVALQIGFHRQLISLQKDVVVENRECRERIEKVYKTFLRREKKGVIAASWWILSQGELTAGNEMKALEARRKSKGL
ncbi:MAG: hypothetical protein ACJAVK_000473 [Akkermansiaceae bacterium]|jgi:hypothetical protein